MILSYSIISSVILAFCYLTYKFCLADQRQHAMNRNLLLLIYALSLSIPCVVLALILHSPQYAPTIPNIEIGEISSELVGDKGKMGFLKSLNVLDLIFKIYVTGMTITAIYYFYGICMLWRLMRKGDKKDFGNFTLILVDDSYKISPFCWHNCIVMRQSDYEEDGDMILIHEYSHLRHYHWADLLLAYLTICLQWYNPAAWAMREELKSIHEYQVDESVIESGVNTKDYQLLLVKRAVGSGYQSFANSLNHSKLQKRVTMMYKEKTSLKRRLFALALIPAIGAGITVTSIQSVAGVLESLATTSLSSQAQAPEKATAESPTPVKDKNVFVAVEDQAEFPGGMQKLMEYLSNNIKYPEEAMKKDIQGRVIIKFVIEEDGSVTDAEVVRGIDKDLDKEALRVVNSMPKWTPDKVNGKAVASYFTIPVNFRLQADTPKEEENK